MQKHERLKKQLQEGVLLAVEEAGGVVALSNLLDVFSARVSNWIHRDKKMPIPYAIKCEKLLGIPKEKIRPDIDW